MTPLDLKAFRVEHSRSQESLSKMLGITRSSLIAMERGAMKIPLWMPLALGAIHAGTAPYVGPSTIIDDIGLRKHLRVVSI